MLSFLPIQKDVFLEIDKFITSFESFCFFSFSNQKWGKGKPSRPKWNLGWRGPLLPQGDSEPRTIPHLHRQCWLLTLPMWHHHNLPHPIPPGTAGAGDSTVEVFTAQLWALLFHPGYLPAQTLVDKLNQSEERRWQSWLPLAYWWHSTSSYFILLIRWAFSYI